MLTRLGKVRALLPWWLRPVRPRPFRRSSRRLSFETLEDRLAPAALSASLASGNLTITDMAGLDNILTVKVSGTDLVISDETDSFISPAPGKLSPDGKTLTIALASVTGILTINAAGGMDTITVNTLGVFRAGLTIDGGAGTDTVSLNGIINVTAGKSLAVTAETIMVGSGTQLLTSAPLSLMAAEGLTVGSGATVNSGSGALTLAADVNPDGTGDNGTGTLTVTAGANVYGANITLRGADVDINSTATIGNTSAAPAVSTFVNNTNGLDQALGLARDSSGNIYIANSRADKVLKVTPSGAVSIFASGLGAPYGLAVDANDNVYVSNTDFPRTISKITPAGVVNPSFVLGLNRPFGLAIDSTGNVYCAEFDDGTIRKFDSAGMPDNSFSVTGLDHPTGLAIDSSDNLYVTLFFAGKVQKYTTSGAILDGSVLSQAAGTHDIAIDSAGNLFVSNQGLNTVTKVAVGGAVSTYVSGLSSPTGLAIDSADNLYIANYADFPDNTITKAVPPPPITNQLTVRSSVSSRPMSLGGTNTAVAGINLTDAELARMFTASSGTVTFGDTSQSGDITFTTATPATTAGSSTVVVQSTSGGGKIILDDSGSGTSLTGNGGSISLTAGAGGITALAANNTSAEISTTGATVTLNTTGPIGTSGNRIQFADNTDTAQQNVVIGSTNQASNVFLDGLGSLTLGNISGGTVNTSIDVTAGANLVVAPSATINSGAGAATLKASRSVTLATGSSLEAVDGNITLEANAAATATGNFSGIDLVGATIRTTGSGNVSLMGRGGDTGAFNVGIRLQAGSTIESTAAGAAAGTLSLTGFGGNGAGDDDNGIRLDNSTITALDGAISLEGTGGGGGNFNRGVIIASSSLVSSTGTGAAAATITIQGTGGDAGSDNIGVRVDDGGLVSSVSGAIELIGQGGGGSSSSNHGVSVVLGGKVMASGTATVKITGTGGTGTVTNEGFEVGDAGSFVTTASGLLQITATAGEGDSHGITVRFFGELTSSGPEIRLISDNMAISSTVNGGSNLVTLLQKNSGTAISLGGADAAGTLGLTDGELDRITAGMLQIGDASSGTISLSNAITRPSASTVQLTSGGSINFTTGSIDTAGGSLTLEPGSSGSVGVAKTGNDVTAAGLDFANGSDLSIVINGTAVDTQYNQLNAAGAVDLTGVALVLSGSHVPAPGQMFTIVDNDSTDAIIGTFNNGLPEGAVIANFLGSSLSAAITYTGGTGSNDVVLTAFVPNEPPVIGDASFSIGENSAAGAVVGTVTAQDPDAQDTLTYAIIAGNTDNAFDINAMTGEITVNKSAAIDFETNPIFKLTVEVMDLAQASDTATVTIGLNDIQTNLTIDSVAQPEGDSGTTEFTFTVTSSAAIGVPFTVSFVTGGEADSAAAGEDYIGIFNGMLEFAGGIAGEQQQFSVTVNGDMDFEGNETFAVFLEGITGTNDVMIAAGKGDGTILEDDRVLTVAGAAPNDVLDIGIVNQEFTQLTVASIAINFQPTELDFDAEINWGDGTIDNTAEGLVDITFNETTQRFEVIGTHTYSVEMNALVTVTVVYQPTGLMDVAEAGIVVVLPGNPNQEVDEGNADGEVLVGAGTAIAEIPNATATLVQPDRSTTTATVSVAEFDEPPVPQNIVQGEFPDEETASLRSFDVRVTGAAPDATLTVIFDYEGVAGMDPVVKYFVQGPNQNTGAFRSLSPNQILGITQTTVTVFFDANTLLSIGALAGTVFAIAVEAPPTPGGTTAPPVSTVSASVTAAVALGNPTAAGQTSVSDSGSRTAAPAAAETVTFRTSSRLNLNVNAAQDSSRETGSSDPSDKKEETEITPEDLKKFMEELLKALKEFSKYLSFPLFSGPEDAPAAPQAAAPLPEEEVFHGSGPLSNGNPEGIDPAMLDACFAETLPDNDTEDTPAEAASFAPDASLVWGSALFGALASPLKPRRRGKENRLTAARPW